MKSIGELDIAQSVANGPVVISQYRLLDLFRVRLRKIKIIEIRYDERMYPENVL